MKTKPTEQDERFGAITMPTKPSTGHIRNSKGPQPSGSMGRMNPGQKDYKSVPKSQKSY